MESQVEVVVATEPDAFDCLDDKAIQGFGVEVENAFLHAANLLHMAGRRYSGSAALELIRAHPRSYEAFQNLTESHLFYRLIREALGRYNASEGAYKRLIDFFTQLAKMSPARRSLLEACVAGAILGYGMGG